MTQSLLSELTSAPDWLLIEQWHQDLMADRLLRIRGAFAAAGLGDLMVTRSPAPSAPKAASNRFLLNYWHSQCGGGLPPIAAIDPVRLAPALGRILVVEPVDHGADFRYRLFGTEIAAVSGIELTGKLVSEHPQGPEVVCLGIALYRAMMERPEPVLTVSIPYFAGFSRWERMVLPFTGRDGRVGRFVVGNVAFDRDGRELHS